MFKKQRVKRMFSKGIKIAGYTYATLLALGALSSLGHYAVRARSDFLDSRRPPVQVDVSPIDEEYDWWNN
jgi:hypothetical protein